MSKSINITFCKRDYKNIRPTNVIQTVVFREHPNCLFRNGFTKKNTAETQHTCNFAEDIEYRQDMVDAEPPMQPKAYFRQRRRQSNLIST
jgi:hypothetical protein